MKKINRIYIFAIISVMIIALVGCKDQPDPDPVDTQQYKIVNGGFETGDLNGWTIAKGLAFQDDGVSDLTNDIYFNAFYNKDGTYFYGRYQENEIGVLHSSEFTIGGSGWISFKLGGGKNIALTYISIKAKNTDIELARFGHTEFNSSTASSMIHYREANLVQYVADISAHIGTKAYIEIVDQSRRNWGFMTFDSFETFYESVPVLENAYTATDIKPNYTIAPSVLFEPENGNFASGDLSHWSVAYNSLAFQNAHVVSSGSGYRLINRSNEGEVGVLRSALFRVGGTGIASFRLGAAFANQREHIYVSVKTFGTNEEIFRTFNYRGRSVDEEGTHLYYLNLSNYIGQYCYFEIVDNATNDWGLIILEGIQTHYPTIPQVQDEVAVNLLDNIKTERTFSNMREAFSLMASSISLQDLTAHREDAALDQFYSEHFLNLLNNTFYATIDGVEGKFGSVNRYLIDNTTYIITGDINAMWLRDSSAQVVQYLHFINEDEDVKEMVRGLLLRQFMYIRMDPYANAFYENGAIHERKFEIDSLCYPIWLAYQYWQLTNDESIFDPFFMLTVDAILDTFEQEQNHSDLNYDIWSVSQSDKLKYPNDVALDIGLVWNGFRPSDDVCQYKYLIPSNMFAVVILDYLDEMISEMELDTTVVLRIRELRNDIDSAIQTYGTYEHPTYGTIYAYEVDGLGNYNLMDDANIPSLLSAPWLGYCRMDDEIYQNTRRFILSTDNRFYFEGSAASGIGSEHTPTNYAWHMALAMQMMTTDDELEALQCLEWMVTTTANTWVMHEGFNVNNPSDYSRDWFTWPCSLFAEAVIMQIINN